MCGAKLIRKYIDPKVYAADVERGIAPTKDNITEWAGRCDRVVAYSDKTVFIRPHEMYNEDGSYSEIYNNLVNFLEVEVARSIEDGGNIRETGNLKRRLHSLKSNMVELFIGGITQADRDSLRDLVEDAVLNIRSAANHGVGFGANMSASVAISTMAEDMNKSSCKQTDLYMQIFNAIRSAYKELFGILFENIDITFDEAVNNAAFDNTVFNIRTNSWNTNVKSSIMSDITILDTVSRIIGIMATCNQFIVPTAMHNIYTNQ
jgi:chaperonin GroEL (HSP60 family)